MQQPMAVERQVLAALHKRFKMTSPLPDDLGYLKHKFLHEGQSDVLSVKKDIFIYSFLRKWKGLETGIDLERETVSSWTAAELRCFNTNRRLEWEATIGFTATAARLILSAQQIIASILGPVRLDIISTLCRHANGATSSLRRGTTLSEKIARRPTVTFQCFQLLNDLLVGEGVFARLQGLDDPEFVRSSRSVQVPKSAKINRMIAAEPTLNVYVQQGIGRYIRRRLLQHGVNLNDQTINKDYAFRALVDGFTTLDLSMASDTLSFNLVKLLLPQKWFSVLSKARCTHTVMDGKTYLLSKFSSMGNSYTFELESLIFYAISKAACEQESDTVSVYGDDIICEHRNYPRVRKALEWAGFCINEDKSFTDGSRFFESCGGNYYDLEDVTPPYQKDVCDSPRDYIALHNRLVRAGIRLGFKAEVKDACAIVRARYAERYPRHPLTLGPLNETDHFFIDLDFDFGLADRVRLRGLVAAAVKRGLSRDREMAVYMYAMRTPDYKNSHVNGYVQESGDEYYVFKDIDVWRSATSL